MFLYQILKDIINYYLVHSPLSHNLTVKGYLNTSLQAVLYVCSSKGSCSILF